MPDDRRQPERETISVQRAAEILAVHEDTVTRLIAAGKLLAFKVGRQWRIHRADLAQYRQQHTSRHPSI